MVQSSTPARTMHHHDTTSSSTNHSNCGAHSSHHTSKQESRRRETTGTSVEMDRFGNISTTSNSSNGSCSSSNSFNSFDSFNSYNGFDSSDSYDNQQAWVSVTIIEDDDLMFGGKPLCTWYEEDRRCSMGEESALSPCSSIDEEEEMHRGRPRDRPQYNPSGKHHKSHESKKQQH
ncbi:hypothetical protein SPBR_08728 [Sporothrix brasiliensis 5110]|uniref:Uncharacterized protein n=1 Tax=Sporothrix brasiliensis 5110 TaxID=1398154 RepID=A0A0C2IAR5_9PEZI|nr:uncharacterized protein SPBR_08728 [Sporothrix brasiliensis 5110]KIH86341.1 hypothetical protein SPBR_08728 [Sporothrix brasiliensis 5110]